jgi:hypothetical protein
MLSDAMKQRIAEACVSLPMDPGFGRGVLVGGQLIVTAAHNVLIQLEQTGRRPLADTLMGLGLGDHAKLPIETAHGRLFVAPLVIEPVADIAVLGPLDEQAFWEDVQAYEAWCEAVTPVALCVDDLPLRQPVPVTVLTHRGTWLAGTAEQWGAEDSRLWVTVPDGIEGGTSGSPIVNMHGAIVGIVSQFGGGEADTVERGRTGPAPRPHLTLPPWIMRQILAATD